MLALSLPLDHCQPCKTFTTDPPEVAGTDQTQQAVDDKVERCVPVIGRVWRIVPLRATLDQLALSWPLKNSGEGVNLKGVTQFLIVISVIGKGGGLLLGGLMSHVFARLPGTVLRRAIESQGSLRQLWSFRDTRHLTPCSRASPLLGSEPSTPVGW